MEHCDIDRVIIYFRRVLDKMTKNILVMSNKGGVGKTMVAANLAVSLSKRGYSVGLLDIDIHGPDVPEVLGIKNESLRADNNMIIPLKKDDIYVVSSSFLLESEESPIIWRGPLKAKLINEFLHRVKWPSLDFLVIDLPPGTGDETITIVHLLKENSNALIVSTPSLVSIFDVKKAITAIKKLDVSILGIIENMSGEVFGFGTIEKLAKENAIPFLGTISLDKDIAQSLDRGTPFVLDPKIKASTQFEKIVDNIIHKVEERSF